ncbi:MAG: hypothetical protein JRH20_15325, partial [Deltaproteobacteria bacterium]|nr:hypothetical protein [Deltaproteobacteria bacterium]
QCLTTHNVNCDTNNANPANSSDVIVHVPVTCQSAGTWSSPPVCEWSCNTTYCEYNDQCLTTRAVSCDGSSTPTNATVNIADVNIACANGSWMAPAECSWFCNLNYCDNNTNTCQYMLDEERFDTNTSSGVFGYSSFYGNIGAGMSVQLDNNFYLARFGFEFASLPAGTVMLLVIRDSAGNPLKTIRKQVVTANVGWFYWTTHFEMAANTTYIFTTQIENAYSLQIQSSVRGDTAASYPRGSAFSVRTTQDDLTDWSLWTNHSWDYHLHLIGYLNGGATIYSFETGTNSGYFGGDASPMRNVGNGQSVVPSANLLVSSFALNFTGTFHNTNEEVLTLNLRRRDGTILETFEAPLAPTYSGGWFPWDMGGIVLCDNEEYVFTAHVKNGLGRDIATGIRANASGGFNDGQGYAAVITTSPQSLDDWDEWYQNSTWDYHFRMEAGK